MEFREHECYKESVWSASIRLREERIQYLIHDYKEVTRDLELSYIYISEWSCELYQGQMSEYGAIRVIETKVASFRSPTGDRCWHM